MQIKKDLHSKLDVAVVAVRNQSVQDSNVYQNAIEGYPVQPDFNNLTLPVIVQGQIPLRNSDNVQVGELKKLYKKN